MPDFTFSGGVRFNDTCVANVTMDPATGDPLTCCNPITGVCLGGGGGGDLDIANVTVLNDYQAKKAETKGPVTGAEFYGAFADDDAEQSVSTAVVAEGASEVIKVLLYKGSAKVEYLGSKTVAVTGDITYADGVATVTGDGTITLTTE